MSANKNLKLEICPTERALLNYLIARLHSIDADVIVGHNVAAYDMSVLLQRLAACKVAHWSKIGRMRVKQLPKLSSNTSAFSGSNWAEWQAVSGRLMCDTYLSARELLPSQRSYGLKELSRTHLNADKPEVDPAALLGMFDETTTLLQLVRCTENDCFLSLQLMFKMMVLPLTKQLTNLAGNLWTKSLQGKRAERIEYLLLHEFHKLKFVVPDKETYKMKLAKKNAKAAAMEDDEDGPPPPAAADDDDDDNNRRGNGQSGRKKPAYMGGLVLEPKRGFYDKYVLLLDFNSLYPSIVQEYNICYTTVTRPVVDEEGTCRWPTSRPPRSTRACCRASSACSSRAAGRSRRCSRTSATRRGARSSTSGRRRSRSWPTRCTAASALGLALLRARPRRADHLAWPRRAAARRRDRQHQQHGGRLRRHRLDHGPLDDRRPEGGEEDG